MMRAPGCMSVAVRRPDRSIAILEGPVTSRLASSGVLKWPGVRGVATLFESLSLGYRALNFSAEQQLEEDDDDAPSAGASVSTLLLGAIGMFVAAPSGGGGGGGGSKMATTLSMLLAIGLFIALPTFVTTWIGGLIGVDLDVHDWRFHAVRGAVKLLIFTAYLLGISQLKDVRRVFQYHGAEHKTIYAYEAGLDLTVENVQKQSTLHPRCGTTFLIVVIFVSVILGMIVSPLLIPVGLDKWVANAVNVLIYVALLPPIAAISYELQRISARYFTSGPLRVFLWPGFLFQKITTREPDDDQVEIAIAAMKTAVWREGAAADTPADDEPIFFDSYEDFLDQLPSLRGAA